MQNRNKEEGQNGRSNHSTSTTIVVAGLTEIKFTWGKAQHV